MSHSILDHSIPEIEKALPGLSRGELDALLEAERDGKTRKGAIAAIEAALTGLAEPEQSEPTTEGTDAPATAEDGDVEPDADGLVEVTNKHEGAVMLLRDGRRLQFGETARIDPEARDRLREEGWIE